MSTLYLEEDHQELVNDGQVMAVRQNGKVEVWACDGEYHFGDLPESATAEKTTIKTERDIRKLFVGKEHAGSITRDASSLTVKIKAAVLTPAIETDIRSYLERVIQRAGG
jgi:hypothetical protein